MQIGLLELRDVPLCIAEYNENIHLSITLMVKKKTYLEGFYDEKVALCIEICLN